MKKRLKAKSIKTDEYYRGNKYGRIYKHSQVDSEYGIQLPVGIIAVGWFLSARGARFAADCVNSGFPISELSNYGDWDKAATQAVMCPKSKRREHWAKCVADAVAEGCLKQR